MKQSFFTLLVFSFLFGKIYSQSDYRLGYIIKSNNDSVFGFLDYKGNQSNAYKCLFKNDLYSEEKVFLPSEIKGFRFLDDKYYVSRIVKTKEGEKSIFIEFLINGIVSIFYYRDDLGDHYLIDKGDRQLLELKNEDKEVYINNNKYVRKSKEYIGVLKYVFKDSPSVSKKVDNISLNDNALINIAKEYHNEVCKDYECLIYEKKPQFVKIIFGPFLGINYRSMKYDDIFGLARFNDVYSRAFAPSFGLFVKANMVNLNNKLWFQYTITYCKFLLKSNKSYYDANTGLNYINNMSLSQKAITNLLTIRYEFPQGLFRPNFSIGCCLTNLFNDYKYLSEANYSWGSTRKKIESSIYPFSNIEVGFTLGLGVIWNVNNKREVCLDFMYQKNLGSSSSASPTVSDNFVLNMSIQIGK